MLASRVRKPSKGGLQIAFRIDQEVGRDDDRITLREALSDFDIAVAAMAERKPPQAK